MALSILMRTLLPLRSTNILKPALPIIGQKILGQNNYDDDLNQTGLVNYVQIRGAARRGKRIQRARENRLRANARRLAEAQNPKKKSQKKSVKVDKTQLRFQSQRQLDLTLPPPPSDDVYFTERFRRRKYSFEEIIDFHKQSVHPDVLNKPDALVSATIELNLKMAIKKKKLIERINSTVCYPHPFQYQIKPRKIVALCKDPDDQVKAKEAGAIIAGATDVAQLMKTGQLTTRDFDHVVCHTDFLVDFAAVKGMKGQPYFPSKQRGNYGDNIEELVRYFVNGIDYSLTKLDDDPAVGFIDCHFGKLSMTHDQLRENLVALFDSITRFKPLNLADNKQFFERVVITSPDTEESFLLKFWELTDEYQDPDLLNEDEEEGRQLSKMA